LESRLGHNLTYNNFMKKTIKAWAVVSGGDLCANWVDGQVYVYFTKRDAMSMHMCDDVISVDITYRKQMKKGNEEKESSLILKK